MGDPHLQTLRMPLAGYALPNKLLRGNRISPLEERMVILDIIIDPRRKQKFDFRGLGKQRDPYLKIFKNLNYL